MTVTIAIPPWLGQLNGETQRFADDSDAMAWVLAATRRNVTDGGGPFGAAILDGDHRLVALGVNRVLPDRASMLHAEMLALLLAQRRLATHNLAEAGRHTLVTSCEPCAMCFGAIPFAGVTRLVCGASTGDAQYAGFDEGDKPAGWVESLERRGIEVVTGVRNAEAAHLLAEYRRGGRPLY